MVFSSAIFIFLFLPLALITCFLTPSRWKNATLLFFSFLYYAWGEDSYFAVIFFPIVVNWIAGLALSGTEIRRQRGLILAATVVVDLGVLFYFKYANFMIANLNGVMHKLGFAYLKNDPIHLPLGISFFTFHALSYVIDVYRRVVPAQRNFFSFALYISFFPQLVAGPIIRYHDVAEQLSGRRESIDKFSSGLERFILGLGKKMLIANPLGAVADQIFSLAGADLSTPLAWLGIVSYTFQIYFDFSGYSDMAIGLGRMFGFEFLENFNYPYVSRSIREFWRRWHISLSNWFRDYLYIPLGGNRAGPGRTYFNLITVFFLCGLWHGASWNFVVWGLIHGAFLALERGPAGRLIDRAPSVMRHAYVLLIVMCAWVFFRADTLHHATQFLAAMFGHTAAPTDFSALRLHLDRKTMILLVVAAVGATPALSLLSRDWHQRRGQVRGKVDRTGDRETMKAFADRIMIPVRPVVLALIFIISATYLAGQSYNPFIYFRF